MMRLGLLEFPIEQLSTLQPSESATDFGLALSWARDILSASNRKGRRIVLVSDLQSVDPRYHWLVRRWNLRTDPSLKHE